MGTWLEQPSPSDFDRWEALLVTGVEPSTAAKELGYTSSQFRRANKERHKLALELSREARGHYADERAEEWALAPDADDRMRDRWLKRWQPAYAGVQRVELMGAEGGAIVVAHERRLTLADVADFDRSLDGPGGGVVGGLPVAQPVAEPFEG